jgi:uncharacterized Tic20 family protein
VPLPFNIECPKCQAVLTLTTEEVGTTIECRACREQIRVPNPPSAMTIANVSHSPVTSQPPTAPASFRSKPYDAPDDSEPDDRDIALPPGKLESETRMWGLLLHLATFLSFVVPFGGLIAQVVIWQLKKNELPGLDKHGKNAMNFALSTLIYMAICIPFLCIPFVNFLVLLVMGGLAVINIVFPIIAAVQANNGQYWEYPLSIKFF